MKLISDSKAIRHPGFQIEAPGRRAALDWIIS